MQYSMQFFKDSYSLHLLAYSPMCESSINILAEGNKKKIFWKKNMYGPMVHCFRPEAWFSIWLTAISFFICHDFTSSLSTTRHKLLLQFSTCGGQKWVKVGSKWKKLLLLHVLNQFHENFLLNNLGVKNLIYLYRCNMILWCIVRVWKG